jgi:hypothetical protein
MVNSYGRLHQLARAWQVRAEQDAATARRQMLIGDELKMVAYARRNCAWELRKVLIELEKENPSEDGLTSAPQTESESG